MYLEGQKVPLTCDYVEPRAGVEPATYALRVRCSTY